jgi:hypothetical protein
MGFRTDFLAGKADYSSKTMQRLHEEMKALDAAVSSG